MFGLNAATAGIAVAAFLILGLAIFLWAKLRRPRYVSRGNLLTNAEQRFFRVLVQAVPDGIHICPQVRLADLIDCYRDNRRSSFAAIAHKHIDFVLVDSETSEILLAIELDDSSHDRPDRIERDLFVDRALDSAGVPILRVRAAARYEVRDLSDQLGDLLARA